MNTTKLKQNERLIHFRLKAELNQSELANESNLTPAAISLLEKHGGREPTLYTAKNIAKALGVSLDVFAGNASSDKQMTDLAQENNKLKRKLKKARNALD